METSWESTHVRKVLKVMGLFPNGKWQNQLPIQGNDQPSRNRRV
ncbi:MAG: hypothetical protein ABSG33_01645 [Candidatus Bathyarchaeia archaeon]